MSYTFELYGVGTDQDVTQTYSVYVRRSSDDQYLDNDDDTWKAFGDLVTGKHPLTESSNIKGVWEATFSLGSSETGVYTFYPFDDTDNTLVANQVKSVFLYEGEDPLPASRDKKLLNTHFGGFENLQLVDDDGIAVEGAEIRVYTKQDYDAESLDVAIGITHTDYRGYWADPVPVTVGTTYTVQYHKSGVIGPTSVEVAVP